MPRVKIDYIVSFSSEDPDHPASNLLAWEVSKKKWLCKKGETSCSVVLQLTKAVKISSVHIGAYHSALVEVLVARSEKGNEQYQVLVPSCVFVPPAESRRDSPVERVRSFSSEQLAGDARTQRWDRVRVVCSQPYNKHCKYGLSFIHIDESGDDAVSLAPAASTAAPAAVPARMLALETYSSDEEEFRPGELFAKHHSQGGTTDTGAQIRQATSQALKNIPDSSTKLMKTPISKPSSKREPGTCSEGRSDRTRDDLLYTRDDEQPHTKIDQVVQRHKDQKDKEDRDKAHEKREKEERVKAREKRDKEERVKEHEKREKEYKGHEKKEKQDRRDRDDSFKKVNDEGGARKRRKSNSPAEETPPKKKINKDSRDSFGNLKNRKDDKKRRRRLSSGEDPEQEQEEVAEPHTLLQDVVAVLSGYENPERGAVRNTALALGARVQRAWGPTCTHLICAFPNTPKLRQVRAACGPSVPVVLAEWVLQCSHRRRRLPWQWFATEDKYRRPEQPLPPLPPPPPPLHKQADAAADKTTSTTPNNNSDTDCDTDDEIEKVLKKQKEKLDASDDNVTSPSTEDGPAPRMEVDEEPSTDEESTEEAAVAKFGGALPNFFDGHTFAIDAEGPHAEQLSRYVKAYGGLVIQLSELDEDTSVEYIVSGSTRHASGAKRVTPAWVEDCHRAGRLLPPD